MFIILLQRADWSSEQFFDTDFENKQLNTVEVQFPTGETIEGGSLSVKRIKELISGVRNKERADIGSKSKINICIWFLKEIVQIKDEGNTMLLLNIG